MLAAGAAFEQMAHDLRLIPRLANEREANPTAAIPDSRTVQSTPESGPRAGYDGHQRRKGSKVHAAVGTLGHLLAPKMTVAAAQNRAQMGELAQAVQEATGASVEVAFVDQGHTGPDAAGAAQGHGIRPEVVKHGEAKGVRAPTPALGGGTDVRLSGPVPPAGP